LGPQPGGCIIRENRAPKKEKTAGVWLFIPPVYLHKTSQLQSEGVFRFAFSVLVALNQLQRGRTVVVVPWGFEARVKKLLETAAIPLDSTLLDVRQPSYPSMGQIVYFLGRALNRITGFLSGIAMYLSKRVFVLMLVMTMVFSIVFWLRVGADQNSVSLSTWPILTLVVFVGVVAATTTLALARLLFSYLISILNSRLTNTLANKIYEIVEKEDSLHLAKFANKQNVHSWWAPSSFFSATSLLKSPTTVTFLDFVPLEDKTGKMMESYPEKRFQQIKDSLDGASAIICLSEYVKESHLKAISPQNFKKAIVARPGAPVFLSNRLPNEPVPNPDFLEKPIPASKLERSLSEIITITVPTQNRPYKGLDWLLHFLVWMRKNEKESIRLNLTCDPADLGIGELTRALGLEDQVFFHPKISDESLERLIRESTVCLSASKFEASLPFTFAESVSTNTPCLLIDMPVTKESLGVFPAELIPTLMFQGNTYSDLASKLIDLKHNRDELLLAQKRFMSTFYLKNSWHRFSNMVFETWDIRG